jgi:hypothetical protein
MSDPAPSSGAPAAAAVVADGAELSVDAKLELITRNLQEVMGDEVAIAKLRAIIEKRPLKLYWVSREHTSASAPLQHGSFALRTAACVLTASLCALLSVLSVRRVLQRRVLLTSPTSSLCPSLPISCVLAAK